IKAKADTNRERLKCGLQTAEKPTPIGMHTQGSYSMKMMIQEDDGDYDIDDGVYFEKYDLVGPRGGEGSARDVREMVCEARQDSRFKRAPEVRK
ncbi:cyclic GMP-AMP synthase DncV-like nucleotidyltransferase, partial [Rhizobium ruizarguesonis]